MNLYRQIQGDNFLRRDVKLSDRELLAIDLVIEQIRKKYGMRELTANDTLLPATTDVLLRYLQEQAATLNRMPPIIPPTTEFIKIG